MDMTPMVDVTFLLLIFFMVTAAFSLQKSIEMPRQQTDAPSTSVVEEESEDLDMVEVQVDEFGSFLVMAPDWETRDPGKTKLDHGPQRSDQRAYRRDAAGDQGPRAGKASCTGRCDGCRERSLVTRNWK